MLTKADLSMFWKLLFVFFWWTKSFTWGESLTLHSAFVTGKKWVTRDKQQKRKPQGCLQPMAAGGWLGFLATLFTLFDWKYGEPGDSSPVEQVAWVIMVCYLFWILIRWKVFKSIWGTETRGLDMSTAAVMLWLKQIFINRLNEAVKNICCPGASYTHIRSRTSTSVIGNCHPVKSYWKKTTFENALWLVAHIMFVNRLHCITAAWWSITGKQTVAFHLWVARTANSRLAGMFGVFVEIFVGSNSIVFWSVLILKKFEFVIFKLGYCVWTHSYQLCSLKIWASVAVAGCGCSERSVPLEVRSLLVFVQVNNLCGIGHLSRF